MLELWLALYVGPTGAALAWLVALRGLSGPLPMATVVTTALTNMVTTQFYRQGFASGLSWESGGAPQIKRISIETLVVDIAVFGLVLVVGWAVSRSSSVAEYRGWMRPALSAPFAVSAIAVHACQALSPPLFASWNALSALGAAGLTIVLAGLAVSLPVQLYDGFKVLRGSRRGAFGKKP